MSAPLPLGDLCKTTVIPALAVAALVNSSEFPASSVNLTLTLMVLPVSTLTKTHGTVSGTLTTWVLRL